MQRTEKGIVPATFGRYLGNDLPPAYHRGVLAGFSAVATGSRHAPSMADNVNVGPAFPRHTPAASVAVTNEFRTHSFR